MAEEIEHLDFTPSGSVLEAALKAWRKPIEPFMARMTATRDKPLAELTMPDLISWVLVFGYAAATGAVLGHIGGNLLASALRGPVRIR
jgi:hypothetical protein